MIIFLIELWNLEIKHSSVLLLPCLFAQIVFNVNYDYLLHCQLSSEHFPRAICYHLLWMVWFLSVSTVILHLNEKKKYFYTVKIKAFHDVLEIYPGELFELTVWADCVTWTFRGEKSVVAWHVTKQNRQNR